MRDRFWETVPLGEMTEAEWEALCDGCGKCCLNKLEDEDTGEVAFTRVACRLFDDAKCACSMYDQRLKHVPECVVLRPDNLDRVAYFMPKTCAYRLLHEGRPLYPWHPLVAGDSEAIHRQCMSVRGLTVSEATVPEDDWEDYLFEVET